MIQNEGGRRVLHIPGWVGFGLFVFLIALGIGSLIYWAFWVPGESERATLCPKHEGRAESYRHLSEVRPLRDYELAGWATSDEYVRKWCQ